MSPKRPRSENERRFYAAWKECQKRSECDGWNSAECWRVFREWRDAGRPARIQGFIREHANAPAGGAK